MSHRNHGSINFHESPPRVLIEQALHNFAVHYKRLLPSFIYDVYIIRILIDVLPVEGGNMMVPVEIKSTAVLRIQSCVAGELLACCAHDELWDLCKRVELLGSASELACMNIEETLSEHLSICHKGLESSFFAPVVVISDRAAKFLPVKESVDVLKRIQIVALSKEYQEATLSL